MSIVVRTVALATCTELPHLDGDEIHLVNALRARNIEPHIIAWDTPSLDGANPFLAHPMTVIRSTWDYTTRVAEFVAWADRLEIALKKQGGALHNGASIVRWNTHKKYLVELEREGVAIVPTEIVARGSSTTLRDVTTKRGWGDVVVKPAVSAGSRDTSRLRGEATHAFDIATLTANGDVLVQPFVDGIARGELSLIYVDGAFSHAVNKTPKGADFRSQPEFGSHVERVEPTAQERRAADEILRIVGATLLYGRVDFVRDDDGKPLLMELELVEPSLYLAYDDKAADRLAAAIDRRLA